MPGFPDATSNTYYTSSVGYSLTYDTRDNKKRPTSGVYYTVAQDLAGFGGDVRFLRTVGEARGYYAVTEDVTAMGRATGGIITGWGGQDVRLLDLFYRGGETVRGFATAGIGPRDTQSANQDALGGRMYYGTTAELLFQDSRRARRPRPARRRVRRCRLAVGRQRHGGERAGPCRQHAGAARLRRRGAGLGFSARQPARRLRLPVAKQPYDKTQALSFGLRPF